MKKPELYNIPSRSGGMDIIESDIQLTDEEQRAKDKRMVEIKKMIAIQSLQTDESSIVNNSPYNTNNSYYKSRDNNNYQMLESNLEKEKRAREQVGVLV